jgi:hypothetical protein
MEIERLKSLTPGEKMELGKGVMEREKVWEFINLYNKENDLNWSNNKRKRDWGGKKDD